MLFKKLSAVVATLLTLVGAVDARGLRGGGSSTVVSNGFNNGKAQVGMNFNGFGGDYPLLDQLKNSAFWSLVDNNGVPLPTDINPTTGLPIPGQPVFTAHSGVYQQVFLAAAKDMGSVFAVPQTGKGDVRVGTYVTVTIASITPGSNTSLVFGSAPLFRAGMEVPITGTTGTLSVTNASNTGPITNGGATGAFTVCNGYVTGALTVPLCLNNQTTPVTTTGTATVAGTAAYGRNDTQVATKGLKIVSIADNPLVTNIFIYSSDATFPISALAMVPIASYPRYEQFIAGTCPDPLGNFVCQFDAFQVAKHRASNFGVSRYKDKYYSDFDHSITWSDRTPLTYWSYNSGQVQSSKYTSTVSSVQNDYSITFGSGAPPDKTQVFFTVDATGVTVTGSAINWTAHGTVAGKPFHLFHTPTGTLPAGLPTTPGGVAKISGQIPQIFYVQTQTTNQISAFSQYPPYNANLTYANTTDNGNPVTVDYLGTAYASIASGNLGNTPSSSPTKWQLGGPTYEAGRTYGVGDRVNSGGTAYRSLQANNTGNTPSSSPTFWASSSSSSVALTTTGTATLSAHVTVVASDVGTTAASATLVWPNNNVAVNDPVVCTQIVGTGWNDSYDYFVKTVSGDNVTLARTVGGTALLAPSTNSGPNYPVTGGSKSACARAITINMNGSGAKVMRSIYGDGIPLAYDSQPLNQLFGKNQTYGLYTYLKVLGQWWRNGGDGPTLTSNTRSLWPPELSLQWSIATGTHPYTVTPPFVLDGATDSGVGGATDYMPEWIKYVRDNKPSWMVPRWEPPNEDWNPQFLATRLANSYWSAYADSANAYYGGTSWSTTSNSTNASYGKQASILGQMLRQINGGTLNSNSYQMLIGVQTFTYSQSNGIVGNQERFISDAYVNQTSTVQSGLTYSGGTLNFAKDPAKKWFTHATLAQYFSPGLWTTTTAGVGSGSEEAMAAAYTGGEFQGYVTAPNQLTVTFPSLGPTSDIVVGKQIWGFGVPANTTITAGTYPGPFTISNSTTGNLGASGDSRVFQFGPVAIPADLQRYVDSANVTGTFNGQIDGTTGVLTVNSIASGLLNNTNGNGGDHIRWSGGPDYIQLGSQLSGSAGGSAGATYNTNYRGANITARTMTDNGVFSIPMEDVMYRNVCAHSASYTNNDGFTGRCTGYEGSWSPDYSSSGPRASKLDQIRWRSKYVTSTPLYAQGVRDVVLLNLNNAKARGVEFPSMFTFAAATPTQQVWGALEDIYQPAADSPVYMGYQDFTVP